MLMGSRRGELIGDGDPRLAPATEVEVALGQLDLVPAGDNGMEAARRQIIELARGAPLLAERTIAVDARAIPLGAPVFLATTLPLSKTPLSASSTAFADVPRTRSPLPKSKKRRRSTFPRSPVAPLFTRASCWPRRLRSSTSNWPIRG